MKKLGFRLLTALLLCLLLSASVFADMGPKPSVEITIEGLEGRQCYATLLSEEQSTGPYSAWDGGEGPPLYELEGEDAESFTEAFYAFAEYKDPDGLYFLGTAFDASGGSFTWGYYPPCRFRVALYFPDSGEIVTGERLERSAFREAFRASLLPDGSLSAFERTTGPAKQLLPFLLRLAATILIELLVAAVFGYRARSAIRLILGANLVTQLVLNLVLALCAHSYGSSGFLFTAAYVVLELLVFAVEATLYAGNMALACPEKPGKGRAVLYALCANAASFGLGLWLSELFPLVF